MTMHRVKQTLARLRRFVQSNDKVLHQDPSAFEYSQEWYDNVYHLGRVGVDHRSFSDVNADYERRGYRKRLYSVLENVDVSEEPIKWLEVGCHLGLTAFWVISKYPQAYLYMFDFSEQSIQWCHRQFPYPDQATIWRGSVEDIRLPDHNLTETFDFITCIDVTEHLPDPIYTRMIRELWRVLKPNGYLILMQGNNPPEAGNIEHIHILSEEQLLADFLSVGFILVQELPERHHLLQKTSWH